MGKYNVSGIKIEFNYCFDNYFKDRISSYQISDNEIVDYQINVRLKEEIKLPNFNPKMIINRRNIYETKNNSTIICFFNKDKTKVNATVEYTNDYSIVNIDLNRNLKVDLAEIEYIITGITFLEIAILNGQIPLHASAISYKNDAILFSAPSTTGKSTHTRLWSKLFNEVEYINDDKPLIVIKESGIYATGTPWSGKSVLNQNKKVKLKSIFFINQSENNKVNELDNKQKLIHLMKNIHRSINREAQDIAFEKLNILINKIPMYELYCNISEEAVWTAYNKLYKEENYEN